MFVFFRYLVIVSFITTALAKETRCLEEEVLENECNKCICTNGYFNCTTKYCRDPTSHTTEACRPNNVYANSETTCICNEKGRWPRKQCSDTFHTLINSEINCKPNTYVMIDCNICLCGTSAFVNKEQCTKNDCSKYRIIELSRRSAKQKILDTCDVGTWYSLAPCQYCYCASQNKLVCSTGNKRSKKIGLGEYKLNVCGKDFIKDAIEMIPVAEVQLEEPITETPVTEMPETHLPVTEKPEFREKIYNENTIERSESDSSDSEVYKEKNIVRETLEKPEFREVLDTNTPKPTSSESSDSDSIEDMKISRIEKDNELATTEHSKNDAEDYTHLNLSKTLPVILNKIFHVTLKKPMVPVRSKTMCTPGTTTLIKCNICVCIKDYKFMCTDNICG